MSAAGERIVRIGGGGGFLGDSQVGARQLLRGGRLDYMILDYLAEVTMSLLARSKAKRPEGGYARDFTERVWATCVKEFKAGGVKLVTNAGGLNPAACAERMAEIAAEHGLSFKIAVVEGSDLSGRLDALSGEREMFTGADFPAASRVTSCNAYFGAAPIAAALAAGAEVVITGRAVDSALTLGPLVHEFGWAWDDCDRLAAGSLCGHVLECGGQSTGGIFTDWEDVPDLAHLGYPIAECAADGSFVVTKCEGTGGLCVPATVAEQILYEISDPQAYLLPDVICDFSQVRTEAVGQHRVRVTGACGRPSSGRYKVCTTVEDGWRTIVVAPILGRDAARKATRQAEAIIERVEELLRERNIGPFRATRIEALGAEVTYGAQAQTRAAREVICKVGVEHDDKAAIELFLQEFEAIIYMVGAAGWFGARPHASPIVRVFSVLVPQDRVEASFGLDGARKQVPSPHLLHADAGPVRPEAGDAPVVRGSTRAVPLIELAWARSGDKGNTFNVGVIARRPEYLPHIRAALTEPALAQFFAHEFDGAPSVKRYELPGLDALNFVFANALGGGQMASLRIDPLGKGKSQQLLDFLVPVPETLLAPAAE